MSLPWETPSFWKVVKENLESEITSLKELGVVISKISGNTQSAEILCSGLRVGMEDEKHFVAKVVPFLQSVVLEGEKLFEKKGPRLLDCISSKTGFSSVECVLSRKQVLFLMACCLFGLFDNSQYKFRKDVKILQYWPEFTFGHLICNKATSPLKCIMHYFTCFAEGKVEEDGVLVLERKASKMLTPDFLHKCGYPLPKVVAKATGAIEKSKAQLHADFANSFPGGGALTGGNVQEEILFVIKPECLVFDAADIKVGRQ